MAESGSLSPVRCTKLCGTAAFRFVGLLLVGVAAIGPTARTAAAQSIPGAVLARHEPHHHLAYEDAELRVLRVHVPAHDTTLLHEHDPDYFWIALGVSKVVNAKPGVPDATITSADLSIHYTPGNFAHVARNPGDVHFDNITVELLGKQTNVHNLCEEAVAGAPLSCSGGDATPEPGITEHPAFASDQLRVSLVTIAPGSALTGSETGPHPWIIALNAEGVARALRIGSNRWNPGYTGPGISWRDGVWQTTPRRGWSVTNSGTTPRKVLEVTPLK